MRSPTRGMKAYPQLDMMNLCLQCKKTKNMPKNAQKMQKIEKSKISQKKFVNRQAKAKIRFVKCELSRAPVMTKAIPKSLSVGRHVKVAFLDKRGLSEIWEGRVCDHKGRNGRRTTPWCRVRFEDGLYDVLLTSNNRDEVWWPCDPSKSVGSRASSSAELAAVRFIQFMHTRLHCTNNAC